MRLFFLTMLVAVSCVLSAQTLNPEKVKTSTHGSFYFINEYKELDAGFYMLSRGSAKDTLPYDYAFEHYETLSFDKETGRICLLQGVGFTEDVRMVVNLDQEKIIILPTEDEITYVSEKEVFLVNPKWNGISRIIDLSGETLYVTENQKMAHSSLGFYLKKENDVYQEDEIFFDKSGDEIERFKNLDLVFEIDAHNFLVRKLDLVLGDSVEIYAIVDRENHTVFKDACHFGSIEHIDLPQIRKTELYAIGFCDLGDSRTIIEQDNKGEWGMPYAKLSKKEYYSFITDISRGMSNESVNSEFLSKNPKFYIIDDMEGAVLDNKGKKLVTLVDYDQFIDFWFGKNFIHAFQLEDPDSFMIYDYQGNQIMPYAVSEELSLDEKVTMAGYFAFYNANKDESYIIRTKDMEFIMLDGKINTGQTVDEITQLFPF